MSLSDKRLSRLRSNAVDLDCLRHHDRHRATERIPPVTVILRLSGDAVAGESDVSVSCLFVLVVTSCFGHPHPLATERIPVTDKGEARLPF